MDANEDEAKVPWESPKMIRAHAKEPQERETEGATSPGLHLMALIVMFQDSEEEEVLATVGVDALVRDVNVRLETVKPRERPMGDPGRLLKSSTRRWTITGAAPVLLKQRTEMALALFLPLDTLEATTLT